MDLHRLTKTELYRLATAADINRRSTMNKAALVAALEALESTDPLMYGALELHHTLATMPDDEAPADDTAELAAAAHTAARATYMRAADVADNTGDPADVAAATEALNAVFRAARKAGKCLVFTCYEDAEHGTRATCAAHRKHRPELANIGGSGFVPDPEGAAAYREESRRCDNDRNESWERSDSDGFLSQWASGVMAGRYLFCAKLAEEGHAWEFDALFDLEGNLVAAREVESKYGRSWAILASDDPRSRVIGWFNPSQAKNDERRRKADAAKGFYVGRIKAACYSDPMGPAWARHGEQREEFTRNVEIIDNGQNGQ